MKINFDDLFAKTMPLSTIPLAFSQESSNKDIKREYQQQPTSNQKQQSARQKHIFMKNVEQQTDEKQQNSHSILQKLNKLTKMIEDKQQKSKKQSKVNIAQLTNKLYQPTPSTKKNCTKNFKPAAKQQARPGIITKTNKSTTHRKSLDQIGFPRYVRLYNLSKINSIRQLYRAETHRAEFDRVNAKQEFKTKTSESYLQNYVPFYDRLENQVSKSLQKQKFYENNPQYSCGQSKQLFKPTTIPDKYKNKIECRYNKSTKSTKNTNELQQALNSSLNTSFCSLDKSVEIINRVEEHFFNKMKVIFLNPSEQYVTITEHVINMLSEIEFKILHNFIMEVETNTISNEQFQQKLKDYYYNLPANERLELRNHQTRKKPKTAQQLTSREQQSLNSFKKKGAKVSKYLKKVESFI